jgi:hypothetical protein
MEDYGVISSIQAIPLPEREHVSDFDERQKALKQTVRAAQNATSTQLMTTTPLMTAPGSIAAVPSRTQNNRLPAPAEKLLPQDRDTVTLITSDSNAPYVYAGLDDPTFHATLSCFVQEAQRHYAKFGLTLYYRILPGLQDAQRRFADHKENPDYRLDGCTGIEEYVKRLGLDPARIRKWRQRDKERQFTREMKLLVAAGEPCKHCGRTKSHAPTCPHYIPLPPPLPENETEAKLLAEQCRRMTTTLLGPSVEPFPERVKKVLRMAEAVQEAATGGGYEGADFAIPLSLPTPQADPVPEPAPGTLEELRQQITRMADTDDIQRTVHQYIDDLFEPLCEGGLVLTISVSARHEGRPRIESGDWVESRPHRGTEMRIGRVVDRDKLLRPRIRWFEDGAWQEPRSLYANSGEHPHVLSAAEARDKYPDGFACYLPSKAEIESSLATLGTIAPSDGDDQVETETPAAVQRSSQAESAPSAGNVQGEDEECGSYPDDGRPVSASSERKPPQPTKLGDKSEPTVHGFFYEFRIHPKLPYVVRDEKNPVLGILCECKSKQEAEMKIVTYEREAAAAETNTAEAL